MTDAEVNLAPYAGRWVALIAGQVAGVGYTAAEARRQARHNRPREKMTLRYVSPARGDPLTFSPLLARLRPHLVALDVPVFLVGGAVRDALLGTASPDLDFVVPENAIKITFRVADALRVPAYVLDQERDTGRVVLADEGTMLDFARFRGEDLIADLRARDFTINAMALPADLPAGAQTGASIIDPCGGRRDLADGLIRLTHADALVDDPVRALRALRLAARFRFHLSERTQAAVRAVVPALAQVSPERVRDELVKLMQSGAPHVAVQAMADLDVLRRVLPEVADLAGIEQSKPHHEPVLAHTISVLRWLGPLLVAVVDGQSAQTAAIAQARDALAERAPGLAAHLARDVDGGLSGRDLLLWGALFHDTGKAETQTVEENGRIRFFGHDKVGAKLAARRLRRLRFSREAMAHVKAIVDGHMRPLLLTQADTLTRRAVYRFFRATGPAGLDICLLSLADHLATYDGPGPAGVWSTLLETVTRLLQHYFDDYEETIAPPPLVDGHQLMAALALKPGPEVGHLLRVIEEAQAAGEIETAAEAIALARREQ